jgi:RNA polymerase sigma-70 factor (ECF subfamily)
MSLPINQHVFLARIEEHKRILYKVANTYCRNPDDRQDLIQEMVIQLWQSYSRFDGRVQFSTWMYRVSMNVAISFYRSESHRVRDATSIEATELEIAITDLRLEDEGDDLRLLHQLISQMDEINRALVILYLDGYDHATISEIVGITPTNVATRINRIKQKLQHEFDAAQRN